VVEPPPGWTGANLHVEPPPGWSNHDTSPVSSRPMKRRRTKPVAISSKQWVSVGYNSSDMMRVELIFELFQLVKLSDDHEVLEAFQHQETHNRKKNPWIPVVGRLNRMQRYLSAKGRLSSSAHSSSDSKGTAQLRRNLNTSILLVDDEELMEMHRHLVSLPRLKQCRVTQVNQEWFLPSTLFVRVLTFLDFSFVWSSITRVNKTWFQAVSSGGYLSSIKRLTLHRKFPKVRDLGVFFCRLYNLADADFSAEASTSNEWLTQHSSEISDHVIRHLSKCKHLTSLDLSKQEKITDSGFLYIAGSCHALSKLCLTDCTNITNRSLMQLAFGCPKIKTLSVQGCYQITDSGLEDLCNGVDMAS